MINALTTAAVESIRRTIESLFLDLNSQSRRVTNSLVEGYFNLSDHSTFWYSRQAAMTARVIVALDHLRINDAKRFIVLATMRLEYAGTMRFLEHQAKGAFLRSEFRSILRGMVKDGLAEVARSLKGGLNEYSLTKAGHEAFDGYVAIAESNRETGRFGHGIVDAFLMDEAHRIALDEEYSRHLKVSREALSAAIGEAARKSMVEDALPEYGGPVTVIEDDGTPLSEGDYILEDDFLWITVNDFSVRVAKDGDGARVSIWVKSCEHGEPLAEAGV